MTPTPTLTPTTSPRWPSAPALGALLLLLLVGCAPAWRSAPHPTRFQRTPAPVLHDKPVVETQSYDWWDQGFNAAVLPLAKLTSPARWIDRVLGPRPALDVNAFGEVPDSTWFHNRIGRRDLAPEEVARPWSDGPADGPLTVVSGKLEGVTPGMVVRDVDGQVWFVKFDPPALPEISTAAEVVGARFVWAAGYHVPANHLVDLELSRLRLDPSARTRDDYNRDVPLTQKALRALLINLNPSSEGRLRAVFVREVPGEVIGPFSYRGVRVGDPNDRIPHDRRRSLRGLWVINAWINNTDVRRQNTMDSFMVVDPERRLGYVRHHLIDFGDSLGGAGDRDKYIGEGYEEVVDWSEIGWRFLGAGLVYPYWIEVERSPYRSVGVFEAEVFEPEDWRPTYENPAFVEATKLDTFWGASLLARFDRDIVRAVVAEARYTEEGAADYVVEVLMARRAKLLRHAFADVLPLVDPEIDGRRVRFTDLEVTTGLASRGAYRWELSWNRRGASDRIVASGVSRQPSVDLSSAVDELIARAGDDFAVEPFLTLSFWGRADGDGPRVDLQLRAVFDRLIAIGLSREVSAR